MVNEAIIIHVPNAPISQFRHIRGLPPSQYEVVFLNLKQFQYHARFYPYQKDIVESIHNIVGLEREPKWN